jgi:GT2 family glycosyltransferase
MLVSVIIINYNTFEFTCKCIESVMLFTKKVDYEIILVDNKSTECNPDAFVQRFPNVILVKNEHNGGFAKGNNEGILYSKGDYILLLNSDTYLLEDSISRSAEVLAQNNEIGVIGTKMIYPDKNIQHTARKFRSISWELLDLFRFIPLLMTYNTRARLMLGKYFKADFNVNCDWLNGAFFMFPAMVLKLLPGNKLDERFFMYGEDQLWCYQIKQLGLKCFFLSETTIVHIEKGSTTKKKTIESC